MRILFDQGTPVPLRRVLTRHHVVTAYEQGWGALQNGELLCTAEADGFEAIVTPTKICDTSRIWRSAASPSWCF